MNTTMDRITRIIGAGSLAGFCVLGLTIAPVAGASEWSDTFIGYRYGTQYREPGNTEDIAKNIVQFQHASGYKYGSNFFNLDVLNSDSKDPIAGGGSGATEAYLVYRHLLSLSKVTGSPYKFGIVRDVGITAGFDLNTKNDPFGSRKRMFVVGPTLSFDVPGFFDLSFLLHTEHNHNGLPFATHHEVGFDNTYDIEGAWGIPFNLGIPAKFKGFFDYVGKKGKDGTLVETKPELLVEAAVLFDVGSLAGKKDVFYAGVGYQYWHNKFGNDPNGIPGGLPGTKASLPQLELEVHF